MARGSGLRPWKRGTEAARAASTAVIPSGDLVVTDEGNVYAGDGTKQAKALPRMLVGVEDTALADAEVGIKAEGMATYPIVATEADGLTSKIKHRAQSVPETALATALATKVNNPADARLVTLPVESGWTWAIMGTDRRVISGMRLDGTTYGITPSSLGNTTEIVLPSEINLLATKDVTLNYSNFMDGLKLSDQVVLRSGDPAKGVALDRTWAITNPTAQTFTLTFTVYDQTGNTQVSATKTVTVTVRAIPTGTKIHLQVGDSLTRDGTYVREAVAAIPGMTSAGTRTYDNGLLNTEGRGGQALQNLVERFAAATGADSPFLFPSNVAGAKYLGNTSFWKQVVGASGYDYDGFQKIAKGWTGSTFLFDANGYPVAPTEGDVIVDPTLAFADQFRQWTSGSWATIARPTVEFSFSKYFARFAAAYPNGLPTSIGILFNTNDFYNPFSTSSQTAVQTYPLWKTRMELVITKLREWSSTVPLIIGIAPLGAPIGKWANITNQVKPAFDRNIIEIRKLILADFDTSAMRTNKVFISDFTPAVDQSYANYLDYLHLDPLTGHLKMATTLAGALARAYA